MTSQSNVFLLMALFILLSYVAPLTAAPVSQEDKNLEKAEEDFSKAFSKLFEDINDVLKKTGEFLDGWTWAVIAAIIGLIILCIITPCCTFIASCSNSWVLYRSQKRDKSTVNDFNARISALEKGEHRSPKLKTETVEATVATAPVGKLSATRTGGAKMVLKKGESKVEPSKGSSMQQA